MHPMILCVGMKYEIVVGPLNKYRGIFTNVSKKGYNFILPNGEGLLQRNIYPDRNCVSVGNYMIFWLPAKYVVVDESKITVSDFTFSNYEQNWLKQNED